MKLGSSNVASCFITIRAVIYTEVGDHYLLDYVTEVNFVLWFPVIKLGILLHNVEEYSCVQRWVILTFFQGHKSRTVYFFLWPVFRQIVKLWSSNLASYLTVWFQGFVTLTYFFKITKVKTMYLSPLYIFSNIEATVIKCGILLYYCKISSEMDDLWPTF